MSDARFLSVSDLRARWSCSRTTVYAALGEMQRAGYLRRLWLGRVQRVALDSVERWETEHASPPGHARAGQGTGPAAPRLRAPPPRPSGVSGAAIRALRVA